MKPFLITAIIAIAAWSCTKTNITRQTWTVTLGAEPNPVKSYCVWTHDSTVSVVFNDQPADLAGQVKVYSQTADSTFYYQYKNRVK